MRSRPLAAAGAAALTATLLASLGLATPAAAGPGPLPGVCQYRVCVVTLDTKADSDGDGVTDVDEAAAGTDPYDRWSYPGAAELIDLAIKGELTSFNRHLTEVVILPKMTPDGNAIATGFGAFDLPDKAWLANDPVDGLAKIWKNGFSNQLGAITGLFTANGKDRPPWTAANDYSLVAGGATDWGPNGGKFGTYVGGHSDSEGGRGPNFQFNGNNEPKHLFDMNYKDGSHDEFTVWQETGRNGALVTKAFYTSYDDEGREIGYTEGSSYSTTDQKTGETHSYASSTTWNVDPTTGKTTGSTKKTVDIKTSNGRKTTTTTKTTYDADGNVIAIDSLEVDEPCETKDCKPKKDGYYNSEYIAPGPITDEDFARVVTRINASRTPGPDTGAGDVIGDTPPPPKWPLVSLLNPDGVTVLAMSNTPQFNRAQPEYDPRLSELAPLAGIAPPVHNDNGTTSWPSGEPKP